MYLLYPYPIFRRIFFPIFRLFIKEIKGLENFPKRGPFIVAANHPSSIDGIFLATVIIPNIKKKIHFFSRQAKYGSRLGNWVARRWAGCILVDPENKAKTIEEATRFLKRGRVVAIFPEGISHKEGSLRKGKTGLARLILKNKVPIVPVGIYSNMSTGFEKALFQTFFLLSGRVTFFIGKPISFPEYYNQTANKGLLEEITSKIMKEIGKLSNLPYNY